MGAAPQTTAAALAMVVYVLALTLWAGGLFVLGVVVAPTVFSIVPAPESADAMTIVFRKFDVVAMACAVVVLLAESVLAWGGLRRREEGLRRRDDEGGREEARREEARARLVDVARLALAVVSATLAIVEGLSLSPAIESLHRAGAIRGVDAAGRMLERLHRQAELVATAELAVVVVIIVLVMHKAIGRSAFAPPRPR